MSIVWNSWAFADLALINHWLIIKWLCHSILLVIGGKDWILLTKGTDITESFETSHVFGIPKRMLDKFWVRKAKGPRKTRFTFEENGFYQTIKWRAAIILREVGTGPTLLSTMTMDCLVMSFFTLLCVLSVYPCISVALLTGNLSTKTTLSLSTPRHTPGPVQHLCTQLVP